MTRVRFAFLFVSLVASVAQGQATAQQQSSNVSPALAAADSAFQSRSWQAAADDYRQIVKTAPANGQAWFRLAASLDQLNQLDDAIAAYQHAIALGFQTGTGEFRLAKAYARRGSAPDALTHLAKVAELGPDPSMFDNEPAFASLHGTEKYAAIRKRAEEVRFPCRADHTVDFWVGDFVAGSWDQPGAPSGGELHNTREYEGCVVVEHWQATSGGGGMSMMFYDVNRKNWRMIWADDAKTSSDFEGSYHDGAMRFEGWTLDPNGNKVRARNVLENVSPDVIRHIYSRSSDDGKTWVVLSDGRFTRKR